MIRNLRQTEPIQSSFLSCEKDIETILRKLFIESQPYSDTLKRLLVINMPDCLTNEENEVYQKKVKEMSLSELVKQGYVKTTPKIRLEENAEIKAYMIISFDNFLPSSNPQFRDCTVHFDIVCHSDYWGMDNYQLRPLKIAGYIDGILNNAKLSGIGTFQFLGCTEIVLDENLSGYCLTFSAVHGSDDKIEEPEEE